MGFLGVSHPVQKLSRSENYWIRTRLALLVVSVCCMHCWAYCPCSSTCLLSLPEWLLSPLLSFYWYIDGYTLIYLCISEYIQMIYIDMSVYDWLVCSKNSVRIVSGLPPSEMSFCAFIFLELLLFILLIQLI
jgi:hypothetical protein